MGELGPELELKLERELELGLGLVGRSGKDVSELNRILGGKVTGSNYRHVASW
jgi:hypothetical protein